MEFRMFHQDVSKTHRMINRQARHYDKTNELLEAQISQKSVCVLFISTCRQIGTPDDFWHVDVNKTSLPDCVFCGQFHFNNETNRWLYIQLIVIRT